MISRYTVRPSRDLTSSFERRQAAKEQAKIEQEEQKKREEEAARLKVRNINAIANNCSYVLCFYGSSLIINFIAAFINATS